MDKATDCEKSDQCSSPGGRNGRQQLYLSVGNRNRKGKRGRKGKRSRKGKKSRKKEVSEKKAGDIHVGEKEGEMLQGKA